MPGDRTVARREIVDLVDGDDRVVGRAALGECLEKGLLHRAVAVLVVRGNGNVLLQQRSKKDRWQPGLWTLSSTGHVRSGETYDAAAARELLEELGLKAEPKMVKKYLIPPISEGGLVEREWVSLYSVRTDSPVKADPGEVEGTREVGVPSLRRLLAGGTLTQDAFIMLTDYFSPPSTAEPSSV